MGTLALESRAGRPPLAGSAIVHPLALVAVGLLLLNDHYLKHAFPGALTGKLSDVAGLAFFPLLVIAGWEVALDLVGRFVRPSRVALVAALVATGLVFVWVKTTLLGAESYRVALGALQWPLYALRDLTRGVPVSGLHRVSFVADATDLLALPALALPLVIALRRTR
jgi:hypothetical protein